MSKITFFKRTGAVKMSLKAEKLQLSFDLPVGVTVSIVYDDAERITGFEVRDDKTKRE